MDITIYRDVDREWTRNELRADARAEAAGLDPEQWIGGEFVFGDWLSDCLLTGHIEKVRHRPRVVGWLARILVDTAPS